MTFTKIFNYLSDIAPTGQDLPVTYRTERPGLQRIDFVPKDVGEH